MSELVAAWSDDGTPFPTPPDRDDDPLEQPSSPSPEGDSEDSSSSSDDDAFETASPPLTRMHRRDDLVVVVAEGMTSQLTYDGVDVCASRVAWEVSLVGTSDLRLISTSRLSRQKAAPFLISVLCVTAVLTD